MVEVRHSTRNSLALHPFIFVRNESVYIALPSSAPLIEPCNVALAHGHAYLAFALVIAVVSTHDYHVRCAGRRWHDHRNVSLCWVLCRWKLANDYVRSFSDA